MVILRDYDFKSQMVSMLPLVIMNSKSHLARCGAWLQLLFPYANTHTAGPPSLHLQWHS